MFASSSRRLALALLAIRATVERTVGVKFLVFSGRDMGYEDAGYILTRLRLSFMLRG